MNQIKICVSNKIVDEYGNIYNSIRQLAKHLHADRNKISYDINTYGEYVNDGVTYKLFDGEMVSQEPAQPPQRKLSRQEIEEQKELEQFRQYKEVKDLEFEVYDMKPLKPHISGYRYAIALFSDAHIEETVLPESVIGLNEYNLEIARERIKNYFVNLVSCLNEDKVEDLVFASLGDTISSYLFEELMETNTLTPIEATYEGQNLIYNGLKYICENSKVKRIRFIGIVGNHGRTTKKIQHSNGYAMSYEWLMYKNIEKECKLTNLPIEFSIPNSEMAIIDMPDRKRFIFIHGFQIKGSNNGAVCGIYPALQRLALKYGKVFKQDKIYLGHFHSCTSIPNAVVNGSIIGYNSFALTNGFGFEEPAQMYECYDTVNGLLLTRQIYCR